MQYFFEVIFSTRFDISHSFYFHYIQQLNKMEKLTEPQQKHSLTPLKRKYSFKSKTTPKGEISSTLDGPWTPQQNLAFAAFMDVHSSIFCSKERRKSTKVFTFLSDYLKTRTAQQCRSHFQKVIGKYESINRFKAYCKRESGIQVFNEKVAGCPNFQNIFFNKLIKEQQRAVAKFEREEGLVREPKYKEIGIQTEQEEQKQTEQICQALEKEKKDENIGEFSMFVMVPQYLMWPY